MSGTGIGFDKAPTINQIVSDYDLQNNGTVLGALSAVWDGFADKAAAYPRLQEWYVRRAVLINVTGGVWQDFVDWEQAGVSEKYGGTSSGLKGLLDMASNEVTRLEKQATASRGVIVGRMTAGQYDCVPRLPQWGRRCP